MAFVINLIVSAVLVIALAVSLTGPVWGTVVIGILCLISLLVLTKDSKVDDHHDLING